LPAAPGFPAAAAVRVARTGREEGARLSKAGPFGTIDLKLLADTDSIRYGQ
jgi:hypothetical protein